VISVLGGVGNPQVRAGEFAERVKLPLEAIDRLRTAGLQGETEERSAYVICKRKETGDGRFALPHGDRA
jgi:hypothetical protein